MVAETGNFTRAAEKRNTSQAAFSRRIKSLEAWLGFDLIDRSVYPTQLTPQGERFREHAGELLRQMLDSRGELGGKPLGRNEHIRIALPFAMATAQLPHWWQAWSRERRLSCSVVVGNIHDLVTSLVSDNVDLMICYHHAQQPIHLDPDLYERVTLGTEFLRPYASEALVAKGGASLPGRASHPVPLLMYSPGVYFARLVDLILENTPDFRRAGHRERHVRCAVRDGARRPGHCLVDRRHRGGLWPEAADPDRRRQMGVAFVFSRIQGSNA